MARVWQRNADRVALGVVATSLLAAVVAFACFDAEPGLAALVSDARRAPSPDEPAAPAATATAVLEESAEVAAAAEPRTAPASASPEQGVVDARIAAWVQALLDDDIRWNASAAWGGLGGLPAGRIELLETALRSRDEQQRVFAGAILRQRCEAGLAVPSDALFEVTVDALRADVRANVVGTPAHPLRGTSLQFLVARASAAAPMLRRALGSNDQQQRVFAAFALAPVARADEAAALVQVLAPRLADNDVLGDALFACHALYRLGKAGLPALRWWRPYVDEQARSLIDLIEQDVTAPPRDRATLEARGRRARISTVYHDAAIEFDPRRSTLPRL